MTTQVDEISRREWERRRCSTGVRPADVAAPKRHWISNSGPHGAMQKISPILDAIRQKKTFDFGADPAAASAVKLSGNFLIAKAMESIAEAISMLEKSGVDRVATVEMLRSTLFACPIYQGSETQ